MLHIDSGIAQEPLRDLDVRVAVCQTALNIDDPRQGERCFAALEHAATLGAQVIVLPELAASGYMFRDEAELRDHAHAAADSFVPRLVEFAARHDAVVVAGLPEQDGGHVYNSAVLIDRSGVRVTYRKTHLWDREKTIGFTQGCLPPPVVETKYGRIGVMICYDAEFPECVRIPALGGADLLCIPVNWPLFPRPAAERPSEIVKIQANASVNRIFIAVADRTETERGQEWLGGSVIVDPDGYPLTRIGLGTSSIAVADIRIRSARDKSVSPNNDVFGDRRIDLYSQPHVAGAEPRLPGLEQYE